MGRKFARRRPGDPDGLLHRFDDALPVADGGDCFPVGRGFRYSRADAPVRRRDTTMNLLVLGGTGKLGEALRGDIARRRAWDKPAEGFFAVFCGRKDFDFGTGLAGSAPKEKDFMDFIKAVNPDCVINAAAVTDVALCESNPWKGFGVNTLGAHNVAKACAEIGIPLLFMSSDYVFAGGVRAFPKREDDTQDPPNFYGDSKAMAERLVAAEMEQKHIPWWIVRTSHLFGVNAGKLDIIQRLLDSARLGATFCMSDESGLFCPTYAPSLAATILRMLARGIPPGIYHPC